MEDSGDSKTKTQQVLNRNGYNNNIKIKRPSRKAVLTSLEGQFLHTLFEAGYFQ